MKSRDRNFFWGAMQDFRAISELGGRIFGGAVADWGAGGADGRCLKAYPVAGPAHPPPQLKCPRCESLNTKFCYYNNYNLSQPRHFCKSCRRYWTRGGVLRNVPVGGGCRKPKQRSSSKSSSESSSNDKDPRRRISGSHSSSDSSGLTPASKGSASLPLFSSSSSNPDPSNPSNNSSSQSAQPDICPFTAEIFPDATGDFSSLVRGAANDQSILRLNFLDPPLLRRADPPRRSLDEARGQEFVFQAAAGEPPQGRGTSASIDWPPGMDPSIYELSSAADPAAYWNQNQWGDGDPSLYLP